MTTLHAANSTRWLSFFNASGETIPSYGVFSIPLDTEAPTTELGRLKLIGKQYAPEDAGADPTTYLAFGGRYERVLALNGRTPVEAGRWGRCTFAFDGPAWARWRPEQDSAITEDRLDQFLINSNTAYPVQIGPYPGTFGMSATGWGFRVLRVPGNDDGRVLVQQIPPEVPFQVRVTSRWVTGLDSRGQGLSPFTWCVGMVVNGLERPISIWEPSLPSTPEHLAYVAVNCGEPRSDVGAITYGNLITVQFGRGEIHAISGGSHYFGYCSVIEGTDGADPAVVRIGRFRTFPDHDSGNYDVEAYSRIAVPNGVQCEMNYSVTDRRFYLTAIDCPE